MATQTTFQMRCDCGIRVQMASHELPLHCRCGRTRGVSITQAEILAWIRRQPEYEALHAAVLGGDEKEAARQLQEFVDKGDRAFARGCTCIVLGVDAWRQIVGTWRDDDISSRQLAVCHSLLSRLATLYQRWGQ